MFHNLSDRGGSLWVFVSSPSWSFAFNVTDAPWIEQCLLPVDIAVYLGVFSLVLVLIIGDYVHVASSWSAGV